MAEAAVFSSKVQQLLAVVEASGFALRQDGKVRRRKAHKSEYASRLELDTKKDKRPPSSFL
jgi:hypothetical protein